MFDMFKIDKNVPIKNARTPWPFRIMEAGDSINIYEKSSLWKKAVANAHNIGRIKGWKFKSAWLDNHGTIWRIS